MTTKIRGPLGDPLVGTGSLPDGWVDGHDWDPSAYERTGLVSGGVVCADPLSRVGADYAEVQDSPHPDGQYLGIGCAWTPTPYVACRVSCVWTGQFDDPMHIEAAPLVHVVPGTATHAMGAWTSVLFGAPVIYVGTIGNPPELFNDQLLDLGSYTTTDGDHRLIEVRSDGEGVTAWLDGVQVEMVNNGFDPVPIPDELRGSRLHGFAYDAHLAIPANIPTTPALYDWRCSAP